MANTRLSIFQHSRKAAILCGALVLSLAVVGCGIGSPVATPVSFHSAPIAGKAMGGISPIVGATMRAYTTGSTYGAGVLKDTSFTDAAGNFAFSGDYSCPSGSFLYLSAVGGNTGSSPAAGSGATATATVAAGIVTALVPTGVGTGYTNGANVSILGNNTGASGATATAIVAGGVVTGYTVTNGGSGYTSTPTVTVSPAAGTGNNSASVLVAALGRCDDVFAGGTYSGGYVTINELTTIAAAYALGGFSSAATTGTDTVVGIGAPAGNSAAIGTTTAAAGLRHAFLNAANIVNVNTVGQTLSANTTTVGASANGQAPKVPAAEINSIGNALVACVNSAGPTSTACTTIFTDGAYNDGPAATNIYSLLLNVAQHPFLCYGGTANACTTKGNAATSGFLSASTAQTGVYTPNLGFSLVAASAPNDLSIAIIYPTGTGAGAADPLTPTVGMTQGTTGPAVGLAVPVDVALDVNDNVYVLNQTLIGNSTQNVLAFTSTGNFISATADNSAEKTGQHIAVDTAGYVWATNSNGGTSAVTRYGNSGGTLTASTALATSLGSNGLAIDKANNVWVGVNGTAGTVAPTLDEIVTTSGTSVVTVADTLTTTVSSIPGVMVDPNQNIYQGGYAGNTANAGYVAILQNTGTVAAPVYSSSNVSTSNTVGSGVIDTPFFLTYVPASTPFIYADDSHNMSGGSGYVTYTPVYTGVKASLTGVTPSAQNTSGVFQATQSGRVDGANTFFTTNSATNRIALKYLNTVTPVAVFGCDSSSGACTLPTEKATGLAVDSTGSVWVANNGSNAGTTAGNGNLIQFVGLGAPVWPQLSVGLTGEPQ